MVVDPACFLGSPALEHLNLSHNAVDNISPQTLPHLMKLFEIDLGYNRLRSIVPGLPRALEHLHVPHNQISSLPNSPSRDLLLPALRTFDITGN
jgi:Leucine-rich repeat (LRR) protein